MKGGKIFSFWLKCGSEIFFIFLKRSRELRSITQLLIALRYYALGSFQLAIADFSGVCITSVHVVLKRVSRALAELSPRYIQMPQTQNERLKAAKEFFAVAKFPRTIGAIDCTHIRIQSPGGTDAENFRNRKGWFSLNVQTVSAANLKINDIVARWQGSAHDQRIFNMSSLKKRFEDGEFEHFILVGDSGYTNTTFLATPFLNVTNAVENLYNESQIRTRNCVERSYGVWKRRFPVLATGLRCRLDTVQSVIVACAVLHNIAIDENESQPPPEMYDFANMLAATDVPSDTLLGSASATTHNVRARLVRSYFQPMLDM
ncbi:putative nuclease HARBI1 [Eupeodes corollae]|uniref:putative nuclease HARBI1 n=1 Tax=Eupeodes corollae TaxID=290404 RepID=UPI00249167D1|nr:putative nuclease HARBI1 [Eupeodes corollae]